MKEQKYTDVSRMLQFYFKALSQGLRKKLQHSANLLIKSVYAMKYLKVSGEK